MPEEVMKSETLATTDSLLARFARRDLDSPCPHVHLLRGNSMTTMQTAAGSGYVHFGGQAVTRWRPDPTCDSTGYYLYLRDVDTKHYWSATYQPTRTEPDDYQVELRPGCVTFSRLDFGIKSTLEVFLAPEDDVEFRKLTLTNSGTTARHLEITSYAELVLQHAHADAGHLAYSKLFVETWQHDSGALCARRRPRESGSTTISACHFLAGTDVQSFDGFETDRAKFLGRGNPLNAPFALNSDQTLSGPLGSVLDPIFSIRKNIQLAAGQAVTLTFALAAGDDRADFNEQIDRYASCESVSDAQQNAMECAGSESFASADLPELLRYAATTLYGVPEDPGASELPHSIRNEFLRQFDIAGTGQHAPPKISSDKLVDAKSPTVSTARIASQPAPVEVAPLDFNEELLHFNGLGGFSHYGSEYVIRISDAGVRASELPPMPWANIISNEKIGFIASETGAGYTWAGNSRLNRLTPWQNDPITDAHGEVIYLCNEDTGTLWSATPGPIRQAVDYEVRHGFGYTRFRHSSHGLLHELQQFVPVDSSVKISWLRLTNNSGRVQRISILSYLQWDLSDGNWHSNSATSTSIDAARNLIVATNDRRGVFAGNAAFVSVVPPPAAEKLQWTCDRHEFLGANGHVSSPAALRDPCDLSGRAGYGFDQCAASKTTFEISPGETVQLAVLLGEAPNVTSAIDLAEEYSDPRSWPTALEAVKSAWADRLSAVQIETPSSATNLLVNGWLPYQNLSCRVWGRSSLYQSGGAYGYRDQLQDAAALLHHLPELTRQQILRHAAHQFAEGDVMHWWHPPQSLGIRTTFSDDLLWLPLFAAEYVSATGDTSLWDEKIPFLEGSKVPPGEPEVMLTPTVTHDAETLYEHCCRALDRGLTTGRNGLPLMGCGDWNDGMNRVGIGGTGESVWMGFFIDYILGKMLPVCERFNDQSRLDRYLSYREQLRTALHDAGWDGGWYRRAYFDDGTPLGTAAADECQIDALVQAWAVLSGADSSERLATAMKAAEARLVDEDAGLIQLLDPPFDNLPNDPGYIKGYLPGVRENGGQYTHGILWFIRAMAELGHGTRAAELLEMISPVSHTSSPEGVSIYKAEPYVIAADVYSQPPHAGRAGWSWYTGSAGWMWRVAVESILGVRLVGGNTLCVDPRISREWPECRVTYRLADRKTVYEILIRNPNAREMGVTSCEVDGKALTIDGTAAQVPLTFDGQTHQAVVTL